MLLALDISTRRTGWALLEGAALVACGAFDLPDTGLVSVRIYSLWRQIRDLLSWPENQDIGEVVFESGTFLQGKKTALSVGSAWGACWVACEERGIHPKPLDVGTWRARLLGTRGGEKEKACRFILDRYPQLGKEFSLESLAAQKWERCDELEAVCIGLAWHLIREDGAGEKKRRKADAGGPGAVPRKKRRVRSDGD